MNIKLFKYYQALNGDSRKTTSDALKITPDTLSNKLNQRRGGVFTINDVKILQKRWNLSNEDIVNIFYK